MAETSLEADMLRPDMEFIATLYLPLNPEIPAEIGEASKKPQDLENYTAWIVLAASGVDHEELLSIAEP
ncbi:hypothetical protein SESBI_01135 [Sesbania bispinosa]|nr:hypothetical protein SESBI_01135 [Sesbania bispinosa]